VISRVIQIVDRGLAGRRIEANAVERHVTEALEQLRTDAGLGGGECGHGGILIERERGDNRIGGGGKVGAVNC